MRTLAKQIPKRLLTLLNLVTNTMLIDTTNIHGTIDGTTLLRLFPTLFVTLVWSGLSVTGNLRRVRLGVALLDGRRLLLGVSVQAVTVFWDRSLIFSLIYDLLICTHTLVHCNKDDHIDSDGLISFSLHQSSFSIPWRPAPTLHLIG